MFSHFQTFLPAFWGHFHGAHRCFASLREADLLQDASQRQRRFMLREKRRAQRFWCDGVMKLLE
jgi:hypothetical protein